MKDPDLHCGDANCADPPARGHSLGTVFHVLVGWAYRVPFIKHFASFSQCLCRGSSMQFTSRLIVGTLESSGFPYTSENFLRREMESHLSSSPLHWPWLIEARWLLNKLGNRTRHCWVSSGSSGAGQEAKSTDLQQGLPSRIAMAAREKEWA